MFAEQTIDFTRGDTWWLWWVIFPVLLLAGLVRHDFAGVKATVRAALMRLVCGLILSAIAVTFVSAWGLWGPKYFTKLRFDENNLALRYHWLREETVISLKEVKRLSIVTSGRRRPFRRLQIETTSGIFRSFGGQLDEDQVAVLDALRKKVAAFQTPGVAP